MWKVPDRATLRCTCDRNAKVVLRGLAKATFPGAGASVLIAPIQNKSEANSVTFLASIRSQTADQCHRTKLPT
jgi:hypothetical protein